MIPAEKKSQNLVKLSTSSSFSLRHLLRLSPRSMDPAQAKVTMDFVDDMDHSKVYAAIRTQMSQDDSVPASFSSTTAEPLLW